jgi:HEAT repeat protein
LVLNLETKTAGASGLLLKNPGAARALAPAFLDPVANSNRRKLVLDLLAQTNTPEAQAVLRELIESRAAAAEPKERAEYIQRLAFVAEPDDVTVKLAQQRLRDPDTALPAAFATGSIARRRERMGDTDGAQALSAELVQAVETANDADRAKYVRALSNTKSTRHLPLYQRLAKANDAETRRAVVMAVASLDGQQSTEIILSSLDDADPRVQVTALRALSGRTPGRAELQRLLALVREGSIEQESFVPLERLLRVAAPSEGAAVRDVLLAMRDAGIQGADVRARVYALLDQID